MFEEKTKWVFISVYLYIFLLNGCATSQNHYVIASTGTVIGVEVSQNQATQSPQAKLGYNRAELAIVPTNRGTCIKKKDDSGFNCSNPQGQGGAKDTTDVLMELRYGGIFDLGASSGIYQRLAIGSNAVGQPGAAAMFIKNADGNVDQKAVDALNAIEKISITDQQARELRSEINNKFLALLKDPEGNKEKLDKFESAATAAGYPKTISSYNDYPAYRDFSGYTGITAKEVDSIKKSLKSQGINF